MTWVLLALRKQELKNYINDLTWKQLQISQEIRNLQSYGNNISDGIITYQEAASCPSSYFGTQMQFVEASSLAAYDSATTKTDAYIQQMQMTAANTNNQYQYTMDGTSIQPALLFNDIYKEELEEYARQVTEKINLQEKELENEKLKIETQMKAAEAEYQSINESLDQRIKDSAPKFA